VHVGEGKFITTGKLDVAGRSACNGLHVGEGKFITIGKLDDATTGASTVGR
jgi:hypothetical protein